MNQKSKDSQVYYKILENFWDKLDEPEKVLFRDIMLQSTNWGVPPKKSHSEWSEIFFAKFKAVEKFKEDIWLVDLGWEAKRPLLSFPALNAYKRLLDKGFAITQGNGFCVGDLELEFWECSKTFINTLRFPSYEKEYTQYFGELPEKMKNERLRRYYENGLVYQLREGKEYRRYVNFGLTDRFNLPQNFKMRVYEN